MGHVLFICTANYYRSRFAELLFNHLAQQQHLNWTAISRGVATELGAGNFGSISPYTILGLQDRGITLAQPVREPLQLTEQDLKSANPVIVLDEDEHRPYMSIKFPDWLDQVTFWHVGDLHVCSNEDALELAEREVRALIQRLSRLVVVTT